MAKYFERTEKDTVIITYYVSTGGGKVHIIIIIIIIIYISFLHPNYDLVPCFP
jgi:hypothetical protein